MKPRIAVPLLAAWLAGCGGDGAPATVPAAQPAAQSAVVAAPGPRPAAGSGAHHEAGRGVYNFRCYFCHGYSGDAKTLAATYLVPPPRNFTAENPESLPLERILKSVRDGIPGTAMKGFHGLIPDREIEAVADFVFAEFVQRKAPNTRYHTPENGWPDHDRYRLAYPFARGEIALDAPAGALTPVQEQGRRLYLATCVSCHDRGRPDVDPVTWESRPLSFPRNNYDHRNPVVDATTSATPYRLHDIPPTIEALTPLQRQGERLFQENCAFCHAADGTGKNWIGSFLEPHPRNLTDPGFMAGVTRNHLRKVIRDGLPGTSMPAWGSVLSAQQTDAVIAYIDRAFHHVQP